MEAVLSMLDREIMHAAIFHDLAAPIGAVYALSEFFEGDQGTRLRLSTPAERLMALSQLASSWKGPATGGMLYGVPVVVHGPVEALQAAIAALPHRRVQVELLPDRLAVIVEGVPVSTRAAGWSLAQAQRWLAEGGGPGLAGARMRVAAKIVGALSYSFTAPSGAEEATVTIHLARLER